MQKIYEIELTPEEAVNLPEYKKIFSIKTGINFNDISDYVILRKSLDARNRKIVYRYRILIFSGEKKREETCFTASLPNVHKSEPVAIIGSGPAGIFAAFKLIQLGFKPIIFERGKEIAERKKDIALLNRIYKVNSDSNYCFGEGGAGTFSDGKLYTRSNKRGDISVILKILCEHGAEEKIRYEAHPHIGTDKLPEIIRRIRKTITDKGGEYFFEYKLERLEIESNKVKKIIFSNGYTERFKYIILATGHSARDIYFMLHNNNILVEPKPFALGVRVEHPQELINKIQYKAQYNNPFLEPATYSLSYTDNNNERAVYSFCMCPGGIIVPSATEQNQIVVNGMSNSKRNSPFANSGIVVSIGINDYLNNDNPLSGILFQENIEQNCYESTNKSGKAPAQRLTDFINNRTSKDLPKTSYYPGVISINLNSLLPEYVTEMLKKGFEVFNKKMRGFITDEAILLAVESRTSSPVRIPRNKETHAHLQIENLYPCGEGAGYSGGIMSSAIDGWNTAEKLVCSLS